LINGGYGVFGNRYFDYYDPKVAELITAFGRYTLTKMQDIAKEIGFEIIYGDTDSLFLNNPPSKESLFRFQKLCKERLDIDVEIKNTYSTLVLSAGKKHYIGYENGRLDIVGMEGKKSDRPEFVHDVFRQILNKIVVEQTDPIPTLRNAMSDLELGNIINPDKLKIYKRLGENPEDYKSKTSQCAVIGKSLGAKKGDLIGYFDADIRKTTDGKSWSTNPADIDIAKYKMKLWNTVKEVLEIAGYDIESLAQEFGLVQFHAKRKSKSKRKEGHGNAEPPSGVTG
jgi:DNA polymerase I